MDPGAGPDAADADHLAGRVDVVGTPRWGGARARASAGTSGAAIWISSSASLQSVPARPVSIGTIERRVGDDPQLAVDLAGQLREAPACCRGSAPSRRSSSRLAPPSCQAALGAPRSRTQSRTAPISRWSYQASSVPMLAARRIALAVLADARHDDRPPVGGGEPAVAPRTSKLAASRFTSHSQGPGSVSSKSLMSNIICRSGEPNTPKFERCASPQSCTLTPDRRRRREVGRHDQRRATEERERRGQHPPVADRDELGDPARALLLEQRDGIEPIGRRLPLAVTRPRRLLARSLPRRPALPR